jgi:hypothetical protein
VPACVVKWTEPIQSKARKFTFSRSSSSLQQQLTDAGSICILDIKINCSGCFAASETSSVIGHGKMETWRSASIHSFCGNLLLRETGKAGASPFNLLIDCRRWCKTI